MRIHSNTLTEQNIRDAVALLPGVAVSVTSHGSRSHAAAFEVSLTGNGYRKNTGTHGAGDDLGATWDEWGAFLSAVFDEDPEALAGSVKYPTYRNGYEFHYITGDRFENPGVLPSDTHKRHTWDYVGLTQTCKKCTATVHRSF